MTEATKLRTLRAIKLMIAGRTKSQAAGELGIHVSALSRHLAHLNYKSLIRVERSWNREVLEREHGQLLNDIDTWQPNTPLTDRLRDRYQCRAPTVHEYHSADSSELARLAARDVATLLAKSHLVGVTWGGTLAEVSQMLVPSSGQRTRFMPLCGEAPSSGNYAKVGSSALATRLNELYGTPPEDYLSLALVPMMLPSSTGKKERELLTSIFLDLSPAYQQIFSGSAEQPALVKRMDTVLTGVGAHDHPFGYIDRAFVDKMTGFTLSDLTDYVYGDIAGCLLPRPGVSSDIREQLRHLDEQLVGVQLSDFKICANHARETGKPGVIVFAHGEKKLEVIHELIDQHVVNHLFVNSSLAGALSDHLAT